MKVCGMRDAENIQQILSSDIDYIGFIFYEKSKRNVLDLQAAHLTDIDFGKTKKIGVFVDETIDLIQDKIKTFNLDGVQLHGNESPEYCNALNEKIMTFKAISIKTKEDLLKADAYHGKVDMILFDTKSEKLKGGTGKKFDWSLLQAYNGPTPFLLSGGIQADDIEIVNAFEHPYYSGVDLNSGFEISPALKDEKLIGDFKRVFKTHN